MASAFKRSSEIWAGFGDAIFEELLGDREAWLADGRDLLISEEGIGRRASRPALLGAHLNGLRQKAFEWGFDRLKIFCMIRRQDHWLASHYAQMSDRNPIAGQSDFERLVEEVCSPHLARYGFGMLLDFSVIADQLEAVAGTEGLMILPHELLKHSPHAFLQKLLDALNTPCSKIREIESLTLGTTANVRSDEGVWRLRPKPAPNIAGFRLPNWLMGARKQTVELTPAIADRLRYAYAAGNERLATGTGIDLEEFGYFDFSPGNA